MLNRRTMLTEVAAIGIGAAVGSSFIPSTLSANEKTTAAPRECDNLFRRQDPPRRWAWRVGS